MVVTSVLADDAIPSRWIHCSAEAQLVWAPTPIQGPLPNFGDGYIAAQLNNSMYVAGVFNGESPPPFGPDKTQRASIPLLLPTVLNSAWGREAVANDIELAPIEELYIKDASTAILRHYAHRDKMHFLVSEIILNNTRSNTTTSLDTVVQWPIGNLPTAVTWSNATTPSPEISCHVGQTNTAEETAKTTTIAVCHFLASQSPQNQDRWLKPR